MRKTYRFGTAAAAVGALVLATVAAPAAGDGALPTEEVATISMKFKDNRLKFTGADQVSAGATLRIVNRTKPRKFGPHTFSLVEESVVPHTRRQRNRCFSPGRICMDIALAHKFDPRTEKINLPVVKAGKRGWDKMFTKDRKGDSWFTQKLGASFSQKVSAAPGTALHYMCAVHPEMHGEVEVVE